MRVLYVIPRYGAQFTANETHGEIVRELQRLDVEVDVLSFTTRSSAGGPGGWSSGFGSERVYRHVQGGQLPERLLAPVAKRVLHYEFFISMLAGYLRVARGGRYDLIHTEGAFPLGAIAALSQPLVRTPYVVTTAGGDLFQLPEQGYGYGHYALPRALIGLALRQAVRVRANSPLSAGLVGGYGADPGRVTVLPVSIADICYPTDKPSLAAYKAESRAMLGQAHSWDDAPLIVSVGRLISLKAPELLIEALPGLLELLGRVQLCIIGPSREDPERGDYLEFLRRRAAELGVADRCTFTGGVPLAQVRDYVAAADVLAVPSLLEGLNRVVIEAGAVGTPSVISDGAGAAALVARYACGLIVPAGDVGALGHALARLLASKRARAECGERALALAQDQSAAAVARRLVDIYQAALGRTRE